MAHYAFLDENNIVTEVIVGRDETEVVNGISDWETYYGNQRSQICKRTSYNTQGGVHSGGGTPLRKNYAGIGFTYDADRDAFIPPQPYPSWLLDEGTCLWQAPVPYPEGDTSDLYEWNEDAGNWVLVQIEVGN